MIYLKYLFSLLVQGAERHLFASVAWHVCTAATSLHHLGANLARVSSLKLPKYWLNLPLSVPRYAEWVAWSHLKQKSY